MSNDRLHDVFLQLLVYLPNKAPAFFLIGLHRLLVEPAFKFAIAIARVVALGTAGIVLVELLVGVVD